MISAPLAWTRKLLASAWGGAADGTIAAFTGGGAAASVTKIQVAPETIGLIILANTVVDVSRFVKANPDPWAFPIPDVYKTPVTVRPLAPAISLEDVQAHAAAAAAAQ